MALAPTPLTASQFTSVAATTPGQPPTLVINLVPMQNLVAPPAGPINTIAATIQLAIADNAKTNTPGSTPLPLPNNFGFTDLSVGVSSETPGDQFKGATPGITAQFLDLTPDNVLIRGINEGLFMRSDTGNDILTAVAGRNILSAGNGINTFVGGSGQDTFLADAAKASASEALLNFGAGDDAVLTGVSTAIDFFTIADTQTGLQIKATQVTPAPGADPIIGQMTLQGFKATDIGTTLTLGVSTTVDGTPFLFAHHN